MSTERGEIVGVGYSVIDFYGREGDPLPTTHEAATQLVLTHPDDGTPGDYYGYYGWVYWYGNKALCSGR
ncbi:MAG: hypothetical protein AAB553_03260 [Patescibacteria group bacterium]